MVVIPGLLVALALRFRGFSAVALAPAFSAAIVGVFGILGGIIGLDWSVWVYAGGTVLTCVAAWIATSIRTRGITRPQPEDRSRSAWRTLAVPLAAVLVAAAMVSRRIMQLIGQPEHFAQNFDNVFHLNAIRHVLETGNASSLTLGELQGEGAVGVYPAVWHSFAALTVQLTGASVPLAENSINIVSASVVWTLACVFFARSVFGNNALITLTAGILSASQIAFPFSLLVWGPLFPNTLATSMLPLLLGIVVRLFRGTDLDQDQHLQRSWWMAFLLALAGASTAHMSVVNALLVFSLPLIVTGWWHAFRRRLNHRAGGSKLAAFGALTVVGAIAVMLVWLRLRPAFYDSWGPYTTTGGAIGEALTNSPMGTPTNWFVTVLAISGVVYLFQIRTHRWLIVSYALAVWFYVVDASQDRGFLRNFLTGNWYQDTNRLAAFLPVFATILGAVGAWAIIQWIRTALPEPTAERMEERWAAVRPIRVLSLTVLTVAMALLGYFGPVKEYIKFTMPVYAFNDSSPMITPAERELVENIADYVPEGAVIADNPANGSSAAYAFGGREVLTPHMFASNDPERILISEELPDFSPEVCAAIVDENVEYVLDFGTQALSDTGSQYAGVMDLAGKPGFELVKSTGPEANLYKITGCD
ncbi:hypothetical protein MUK71_11590 [Arthrobacter zhangbolii]|uniref:Uncharacterized protein n=1 Tax=Arthrobacter zhangbolii TaxID=2886936 RepID=A0A9X1M9X5_9MICC|nr:DUF6541 family protein [Arthrobacter zhangbolii]MCC3273751.1 hypothetical protein [Arthrobacter zhangbolii]UON91246.1 hypothetical protein MUK71_11590 [Arthrobacter zhangbolii]